MSVPGTTLRLEAPVLVAHRGVPALAPENSAASFRAALDARAMVVELDARPTADGLLVVLHDEAPRRMTGARRRAAATAASELVEQRLLADPSQSLLLLDEALALLAGRTVVDVEVKPDPSLDAAATAAAVLAALERAGSPRGVVVTSRDDAVLREVKRRAPMLATGLVHRARDVRDAVAVAEDAGAELVVANRVRCSDALLGAASARGLRVWAYTVNDAGAARELCERGCEGVVTDDYPALAAALLPDREPPAERAAAGRLLLVVDLGSSTTKAALVDSRRGVTASARRPTPVARPAPGRVEHDADGQVAVVRALLAELAARADRAPDAAAIASQRSTGLWAAAADLDPLTPAVSWQDRRGEALVAALASERARLEAITGLPLDAAWTAVSGATLARSLDLPDERLLVPLGSYVAARLTGAPPRIDPTLANRTFLVDAASGGWSPEALAAFGVAPRQLPRLVPTVADHGALEWPGVGAVPLRVLVGDQQAAYVGAAGPTGSRLVVNVGTGGFVMRGVPSGAALPEGARRAPLWTSAARPRPLLWLAELAVMPEDDDEAPAEPLARAMLVARCVALGDGRPAELAARIARAAASLAGLRDRTVLLAGGALASPHMAALLARALPLEAVAARERELTTIGAARLAAASLGAPWGAAPAGGTERV